jgi:hypothetical protein
VWCRCAACGAKLSEEPAGDGSDIEWRKGLARASAAIAGQMRVEGNVMRLFCKTC